MVLAFVQVFMTLGLTHLASSANCLVAFEQIVGHMPCLMSTHMQSRSIVNSSNDRADSYTVDRVETTIH